MLTEEQVLQIEEHANARCVTVWTACRELGFSRKDLENHRMQERGREVASKPISEDEWDPFSALDSKKGPFDNL